MCPILIKIGSITITWFGVMMACAFLAGLISWARIGRNRGRSLDFCSDLVIWVMVSGIVGARIAYVAANIDSYMERPWEMLYVFQGGLIYYGGMVGAGFGLVVFSLKRNEKLLPLLDFVITSVPLAHVFGRIGCFLNGCCYGRITQTPIAVKYPYGSQPWHAHVQQFPETFTRFSRDSLPVHPVQLYEALGNLVIYLFLIMLYRRRPADGTIISTYLVTYPLLRFFMEYLRGDPRDMMGRFSSAQVVSLFFVLFGAVMMGIIFSRRNPHGTPGA